MKKFIETNLNNKVKFKPTNFGKEIYKKHHQEKHLDGFIIKDLEINENGYAELQLHEFMNIYGSYLVIWAKELPCESNIIFVEESSQ